MTIQYAQRPVSVHLALGGDASTCRAALDHEAERLAGHPARLVVDVDAADEVDSLLLGALVLTLKRLEADGGSLELVSGRADVRRLLGVTGLDRVLAFADSR